MYAPVQPKPPLSARAEETTTHANKTRAPMCTHMRAHITTLRAHLIRLSRVGIDQNTFNKYWVQNLHRHHVSMSTDKRQVEVRCRASRCIRVHSSSRKHDVETRLCDVTGSSYVGVFIGGFLCHGNGGRGVNLWLGPWRAGG